MDLGKLSELSYRRRCRECGEVFETRKFGDGQQVTALQQFAEHQVQHQPSPGQWTEAYLKIQRRKVKSDG